MTTHVVIHSLVMGNTGKNANAEVLKRPHGGRFLQMHNHITIYENVENRHLCNKFASLYAQPLLFADKYWGNYHKQTTVVNREKRQNEHT